MFDKTMIDARDIAQALGWSESWFLRQVKHLVASHAFPSPLPGRKRWHAPAVERWIAAYGDAVTARAQGQQVTRIVERERAELQRIYSGRAA